jgi:hypothetical protein
MEDKFYPSTYIWMFPMVLLPQNFSANFQYAYLPLLMPGRREGNTQRRTVIELN